MRTVWLLGLLVFISVAAFAQNRNVATADEASYENSIISGTTSSGAPAFLNTSANTTLTISCTTTNLILYINGQLQICSTDRTLAVGSTANVTQYILVEQDTTNATLQAADFFASSATPVYAYTAPTCPTSPQGIALSSTNPAFWFDLSTGLSKLCTSNGGSYTASPAIIIGSVTVNGTPAISAVNSYNFKTNPYVAVAVGTSSDLTAQTGNLSVTLATLPPAGDYYIRFYADQNAVSGGGACTVSFTFNWTDGSARSLVTGSLMLGSSQVSNGGAMQGLFPIHVGSGSVSYTSTVTGTCGSASYDIHAKVFP